MASNKELHKIPIPKRSPHTSLMTAVLFTVAFNGAILLISSLQLLFWPLTLYPPTAPYYSDLLDFTKRSFGYLTVFISQYFAPTKFVVSWGEGIEDEWILRDETGQLFEVTLPHRGVWVSNHQILGDWLYLWAFSYFCNMHGAIFIILKKSIGRVPFVGWACRFYKFIFLERNWVKDKARLDSQLRGLVKTMRSSKARGQEGRMALMVFVEGTLVTGNTRPLSEKYAEKMGIPDLEHLLLPRSTGLFYTLRALAPGMPDLALIDITVAYPAIKPPYWPEDFYSLGSIFYKGVPPPSIHIHLRGYHVASKVPIGVCDGSDGTEEERKKFDDWLRERWTEKDELMKTFVSCGRLAPTADAKYEAVETPVALRSAYERGAAFSFGIPIVILWWLLPTLRRLLPF